MNTANTPSDNPVEQARSRLLGTLAGTSDRTRELLRTRAGVRYAYEVPDTDQPPTNMVYLDIDGAQFGRAILAVHAGEEMRLVDLGTRNALSKTVPGAGSLLMLAVLAFWLS